MIEELFRRLSIRDGWLVEFGAWDGIYFSNTFSLVERSRRFKAVYIEGDESRYCELRQTAEKFAGRIISVRAFVEPSGENSLEHLLESARVPSDFELLSIDVDGMDYQIWEQVVKYRPKVVVIEINSSLPPPQEQIHGTEGQGSSFASMIKLGQRKGYTCVCHTGNMVFVRNDLLTKVGLQERYLAEPELLFSRSWLVS